MRVKYGVETSNAVNNYFNTKKKIVNLKNGINYLGTCLNNDTLPNFTRLRLASSHLKVNKGFVRYIREEITLEELKFKRKELRSCKEKLKELQNKCFNLDPEEWTFLQDLIEEKTRTLGEEVNAGHVNKLINLGVSLPQHLRNNNVTKRKKDQEVVVGNVVYNLSHRELTEVDTCVLEKGLKFGIRNKKINQFEILARFEELAQSLNNEEMVEEADELRANLNTKSAFFKELQKLSSEFFLLCKQSVDNLPKEELDALIELAKDKKIVISKADKGAAVVVQNIDDYREKMMGIVNTPGKFQRLKGNVTKTRETRLQNIMRSLNSDVEKVVDLNSAMGFRIELKKRRMSDEVYRRILPCGSRAGVLYGLAKIHKANVPLRPIISAVQTYNYKLAKYLDEILKPKVNQTYMLKDTFDFVNKVATLDQSKDKYIVSFDVESLFTNIPTLETIDLILKLVYTRNTKYFHNLKKEELRQLLVICTTESHFQFNKNYYEQTDGVAMGSPLGPLFANIFMSDFERKHMDKLKSLGVNLWYRYVDDIFATLNSRDDAENILAFLNSQHPNIRFTIEHEESGQLPFLDTLVKRCVGKYATTVYHKKTFTGVYLNWTSLTAKRYKIGLIKCLTKRVLRICTNEEDRVQQLRKVKLLL